MFTKIDKTDSEIRQMELELDASMKKAEKSRQIQRRNKIHKIKNHLKHVEDLRNKSSIPYERSADNFEDECVLKAEIASDLIILLEKSKNINDFQVIMQQKTVIELANKLIIFLEKELMDSDRNSLAENRPKILLSLMLLAKYPSDIMPNPNLEETKLLIKAKAFKDSLFAFFSPSVMYSKEAHVKLTLEWIHTMNIFTEWSIMDKFQLQNKMAKDFLIWTKKLGNWQTDHQSHAEWEPPVLVYLNQILEKYYEVFGEINTRKLIEEVKKLNETFSKSELIIEFDAIKNGYCCSWKDRENTLETNKKIELMEDNKSIIDFESENRDMLSNIKILHELMINEEVIDFEKLLSLSGTSMNELSESNLNGLNVLLSLFETDENSEKVLMTLKEIFEFICISMIELVGKNDDYRQEISMIDCTITEHDWISDSVHLLTNVIQMCKKCCAPIRDKMCADIEHDILSISNMENGTESIPIFKRAFMKIFDLLNLMKSDCCNFRLRFLAASIEGKGIAEKYELEKFYASYREDYPKTLKWLQKIIKTNKNKTAKTILIESFILLINPETTLSNESNIPETFYLDEDRIKRIKNELKQEISKEAAIVYIKNCAREKSSNIFNHDDQVANIESLIKSSDSYEKMKRKSFELLDSTESKSVPLIKGRLNCLFEDPLNDKVFTLLKNRYLAQIRSNLNSERSKNSEDIVSKICKLLRYNMACFGSIYDKIILNETQK